MVQYRCDTCLKIFYLKTDYTRHINRKNPCTANTILSPPKSYTCDCCHKVFYRKDCFNKHRCSGINKIVNNSNNTAVTKNNIGNGNNNMIGNSNSTITTGNNNNICVNYILAPFCKEDMDCLVFAEKFEVLNSDNMLETIIIRVNFNPDKFDNHNIFYKDVKNGYGMIYDGKTWKKERINCILEMLCEAREQNLKDIYSQIDFYLSPENKSEINKVLDKVKSLLRPGLGDFALKNKNMLFAHLKKHMVNNCDLGQTAMLNTNTQAKNYDSVPSSKNNGLSFSAEKIADIERDMKLNSSLKKIIKYLLATLLVNNLIDPKICSEIASAGKSPNNVHLRAIVSSLSDTLISNKDINMDIINLRIDQFEDMQII